MIADETLSVCSVVSAKNGKPFVQFSWGEGNGCYLSLGDSKILADDFLEAANNAETDSLMMRYLSEKAKLEVHQAAQVLHDFRRGREPKTSKGGFQLMPIVSAKSGLPIVQVRKGKAACQLSPEETRTHAYGIFECIHAAEQDARMVMYLREKCGLELSKIAHVLSDFRSLRGNKTPFIADGSHRH